MIVHSAHAKLYLKVDTLTICLMPAVDSFGLVSLVTELTVVVMLCTGIVEAELEVCVTGRFPKTYTNELTQKRWDIIIIGHTTKPAQLRRNTLIVKQPLLTFWTGSPKKPRVKALNQTKSTEL